MLNSYKKGKKYISKHFKKSLVGVLTLSTIGYFAFGGFGFINQTVGAKNVTVCASGCDFVEIQAGIDDVSAAGGGTVDVKAGTYIERITMKSDVNIQGAGAGSSIITGPSKGANDEKITGASSAEISGFTITKTGAINYGVYNSGASPTIKNSVITGFDTNGVRNLSGAAPIIQDNEIYSNGGAGGAGIYSESAGSLTINGNEIHDNGLGAGYGIYHKNTEGLIINNNSYSNISAGMYFEGSSAYVVQNEVNGPSQSYGIDVQGGSLTVIENVIGAATKGNSTYGIRVAATAVSTMKIINNSIGFNGSIGEGIYIGVAGSYEIIGNLIEYSSASNIYASAGSLIIKDNTIRNSGVDAIGHGILLISAATADISSNKITENGTSGGAGIFDAVCSSSVNIHHNLIYANKNDGYQVHSGATCTGPIIDHNVIDSNGDDGIDADDQSLLTLHSNTITNNKGNGLVQTGAGTPTVDYQNVYNNTAGDVLGWAAGTGYISTNPLYLQDYFPSQTPFFALQSVKDGYGSGTSPLIDIAEPISAREDTRRPPARGGVRGDIGAYGGTIVRPAAKPTGITVEGNVVSDNGSVTVSTSTPQIIGYTGTDLVDAGNEIRVYLDSASGTKVGDDTVLIFQCSTVGCSDTNSKRSLFDITTNNLGLVGDYTLKVVTVNKLGIESDGYTINLTYDSGAGSGNVGTITGTPAVITDLAIVGFNVHDSTMVLEWTAPDNGSGGAVDSYDIRYLHSYVAEKNWSSATNTQYNITPAAPGTKERVVISVNQAGSAGQKTDLDADGLTDYMEVFLWGTSPIEQDSDGDKYSDATETFYGFSPLFAFPYKPDQDNDGLNDAWEDRHGLDKTKADTDGDGFSDKEEIDNKFDPRHPDPKSNYFDKDKDGLTDYEERYIFGTNESHGDTDLDGYPDKVEVSAGFDPVKVYYFGVKGKNVGGNESGISNRVYRYVY